MEKSKMIPTYNFFTAILGLATAGLIIYLIRRDSMSANYVVWWVVIATGLVLVGIFPKVPDYFGKILGIAYPPIIIIIVTLCMVLIKLLLMDIDRSRQERQIRILTQKLAVYEQEAEEEGGEGSAFPVQGSTLGKRGGKK